MSLVNASSFLPHVPIYEIGTSGPIGYAGPDGYDPFGVSGKNVYIAEKEKRDFCLICCGRGKIEKQGWFGIIRLVKCKCKK